MKRDLILSFVHTDFRVKMAQDDRRLLLPHHLLHHILLHHPLLHRHILLRDSRPRTNRPDCTDVSMLREQLTVRLLPPPEGQEDSNPMSHFLDSVPELFEHTLRDLEDSDMVGITINNEAEATDRAIGINFRRKDQITDVIWSVFEKVAQSNARFNALDKLVMTVHSVKMSIGHGRGIATKGRSLDIMVHLKRSIVKVKAETGSRLGHSKSKSRRQRARGFPGMPV